MTSTLTTEQRERRQQGLGASEVPAVLGVDRYRNQLDIWLEKMGQSEAVENEYIRWGNLLEPVIAEEYARRMRVTLRPSDTLQHPEYEWALCTPDRLFAGALADDVDAMPDDLERGWGVECKNRHYFDYKEWGPPGTDEVPLSVAAQCMWSMFVTGLRRWDAVVLLGGNRLGIYTLRYDEELAASIFATCERFWTTYVVSRITPPLDGSATAKAYLERKWFLHGEDLRQPTPEVIALATDLRTVRQDQVRLETERARLENLIKDEIGDMAGVALPEETFGPGSKITWRRSRDAQRINWKTVAHGLRRGRHRLFDQLIEINTEKTPGTRRFLVPRSWSQEGDTP